MRPSLSVCTLLVALVVLAAPLLVSASSKRGFGAVNTWSNGTQWQELDGSWFYSWGLHYWKGTPLVHGVPFTPMYWNTLCLQGGKVDAKQFLEYCCIDGKSLCGLPPPDATHVLGYNEPDLSQQSNITVEDALEWWPVLVARAKAIGALVGSPAMAEDPVSCRWMNTFMANASDTVDFTTLHWYKGSSMNHTSNASYLANLFVWDVKDLIRKYNKPVWVTEFNLQYGDVPTRYTVDEVIEFLSVTLSFMESEPMVHRYALFDVQHGTCALTFAENGTLTKVGRYYGEFKLSPAEGQQGLSETKKILIGVGCAAAVVMIAAVVFMVRRNAEAGGDVYRAVN